MKTSMNKIIPFPIEKPDVQEMMLDGKPETMLTARGVVLLCLSSWRLDRNELAHDCLKRYCEYIALQGYRGGGTNALAELDKLGKDDASTWIKRTFARHVKDQSALTQYVMGPLSGAK